MYQLKMSRRARPMDVHEVINLVVPVRRLHGLVFVLTALDPRPRRLLLRDRKEYSEVIFAGRMVGEVPLE
jgi:hypothetical protein